jgi:hypothetical protein
VAALGVVLLVLAAVVVDAFTALIAVLVRSKGNDASGGKVSVAALHRC